MKSKRKQILRDILVTAVILIATFFTSLVIHNIYDDTIIPLFFVLAVFLIALTTEGYVYGLISVPFCILAVNFAFTFPFFAFDFTMPANIVSAVIMGFVTFVTSTLTTKLKQNENARITAEREKMRADLLRAISHDLRTPLTAIYGASSTIIDNYDTLSDEMKTDILVGISEDSQWLIRMVENLLSVTKIDSNNLELIKSEVVLEELVDTVLTKFRKNYPEQAVELSMPDDFIIILADAILIEQVLINLLGNAVEHAKGMTALKLNIYTDEQKVIFEVEDDGCGIEKRKLKDIFSGCYSSEAIPQDNKKRCMGIGLSVCSAIIKAHGGEINAQEAKSGGMIFKFSLDMQEGMYE
ncbi:MAG: ATP-binding protein [Clostridia bacterium]|nr:ATP-binding protein [Clostridia bacterium]